MSGLLVLEAQANVAVVFNSHGRASDLFQRFWIKRGRLFNGHRFSCGLFVELLLFFSVFFSVVISKQQSADLVAFDFGALDCECVVADGMGNILEDFLVFALVAFEGDQESRFDEERSVDVVDPVVILIVDVEQSGPDDFMGGCFLSMSFSL